MAGTVPQEPTRTHDDISETEEHLKPLPKGSDGTRVEPYRASSCVVEVIQRRGSDSEPDPFGGTSGPEEQTWGSFTSTALIRKHKQEVYCENPNVCSVF